MSKKFLLNLALFGFALAVNTVIEAAEAAKTERVTAPEAIAMVEKGLAYIKAHGREKGFAAINDSGQFHDRELYLAVVRLDGRMLAHGGNRKMIDKDVIDMQDVDGNYLIRAQVEQAKTKDSYWVDYKYSNPVTKKIEPKSMYCKRWPEGDAIVCGGIYKSL